MITSVIAATPRCGGTLLCETLAATGLAGDPAEYFEPTSRLAADAAEVGFVSAEAAARDLPAYAAAIRRRYASDNGVFGLKLHWDQAEWLRLWTEYLRTLPLAGAPQVASAPQKAVEKPKGAHWPWSRRGSGDRAT
jgi:LPS sulfotransferase NodH